MPQLVTLFNNQIKDNDKFEFLHVSQDSSKKDALGWAVQAKFPWLTVLKSKTRTTGLHKFDSGTPSYALIDKGGNLIESDEKKIIAKLKELAK